MVRWMRELKAKQGLADTGHGRTQGPTGVRGGGALPEAAPAAPVRVPVGQHPGQVTRRQGTPEARHPWPRSATLQRPGQHHGQGVQAGKTHSDSRQAPLHLCARDVKCTGND